MTSALDGAALQLPDESRRLELTGSLLWELDYRPESDWQINFWYACNTFFHVCDLIERNLTYCGTAGDCIVWVHDIFGNPFRPISFASDWRTPDAVGLAGAMYAARDFAAMPILADAIEEAGCDNANVLAHCRGTGPHVRGCWVVDLVLGKT